jgi:hypothetical protein
MYDPHQISDRLAVAAGVSLLAALIVPTAFAVEPMIEGGNERGVDPAPEIGAAASASGFDWSTALLLVVIALVVFGSVLALHHAATRRGSRLATR